MKHTTRGVVATALACTAAACAASTASAAGGPSVPVPLNGVENSLGIRAPEISSTLPVPMPGEGFQGPQYVEGKLLPARALPQIPVNQALPDVTAVVPLTDVVGEHSMDTLGLAAKGSDVQAATPGATVEAPLAEPSGPYALPPVTLPGAGLDSPLLKAQPAAYLGLT
ncbi:hypothetical protein [Streptomyces sp. NPDC059063]|uniref:hypothetical protein n=1 Tax=unclassified Streptomyces TaxID=2593676 RepID=UPI0036C63AD9